MTATVTLHTAKTLQDSGLPERQAAAHARVIDDAATESTRRLVTRGDLYKALLIQTGVIIAALVGIIALIQPTP
ncbi:MAG: hypothetical protein OXG74_16725 [Acidobacteria bacterium]|nr:hypothetical protein [Acidobacteriota bacterium]